MSVPTHDETTTAESGWRRFWNRGGWWRALLATAVYLAIFIGVSYAATSVFAPFIDMKNFFESPSTIFFSLALPILIMGVLTLLFVLSLGWQKEIFGRQSPRGGWWMWIAVALVIIPIALRAVATNWSGYTVHVVLTLLFLGLSIGFAEELITRGVAVNILRRGGHSERVVFVLSSALFALIHSANIIGGQSPLVVVTTVVYAFGFGAMMWLSMKVTGSIIWAMLLHAATDPTTILATGGIDAHGNTAGDPTLLAIGGLFNIAYIAFALLAILLVKGRAREKRIAS